ncbi:enamine deaminase RidA (YjgF/YER057c/UK114 family) [Inhella inkyongensis]|uniref:Enamine deaminase RidA (YjgF/YER057c/UK114 family) n=1 Tax=Inhella inkyongensis TaxID=392593 RepID=A0A840S755_9BURK|nr:RidA family protein [Inhella inkyongensis]MBB5204290.1 enamine deaminase RidA (YjgF/YER057c/UK114 family) [Inhella inkyongensis]
MSTIERIGMAARYSEAAIHNGVIYLAGQVAEATAGQDITAQTTEVLGMVDRLLGSCGSSKAHLLRVEIYLADLADYAGMNAVWDAWVQPGAAPPRATVQAQLAKPEWRVEMVVTAARSAP